MIRRYIAVGLIVAMSAGGCCRHVMSAPTDNATRNPKPPCHPCKGE